MSGARAGFSLVEAMVALVLLGCGALASAAGEAWAAATLARAEAQEDAAAVAQLVLDSLAQEAAPVSGAARVGEWQADWVVAPAGGGAAVRLRVHAQARPERDSRVFGVVLAPPPPSLDELP